MTLTALAFLAAMPIVVTLVCMISLRMPSAKTMPIAWFLAVVLAALFWKTPFHWLVGASIHGVLTALSILVVVYGAVLLSNTLRQSGSLATISNGFRQLTPDRRVQALLLAFGLATLIEGTSGFGTPAALAAPLLVAIGFPPLAAAILALIGHAPAVSFGAVGTPVIAGSASILTDPTVAAMAFPGGFWSWLLQDVTIWNANLHVLGGALVVPVMIVFYLVWYFGAKPSGRYVWEAVPMAVTAGTVFIITQGVFARLLGPELPSVFAGFAVILSITFLVRHRLLVPRNVWSFPEDGLGAAKQPPPSKNSQPTMEMSALRAWLPYILVVCLLLLTRIDQFGVKPYFQFPTVQWNHIVGTDIHWRWNWLYNPAVFPFLPVSVLAWVFYGLSKHTVKETVVATTKQLLPATVAMCAAVAMAQVMVHSGGVTNDGMLISLAQASRQVFQGSFPLFAPWIGALGSFLSGSNTVSNILFSSYQFDVAGQLGLSRTMMMAIQSTGAAVGNMVAIHNLVAVLTVVGCLGQEGIVLKRNFLVLAMYLVTVGVLAMVFLQRYPYLF